MAEQLHFPEASALPLAAYLPGSAPQKDPALPFVTLTFATSLDSTLSLAPGLRTRLSGSESKAMTHYLRSKHDAILVGVSTVLADNPALNCRIGGVQSQPRPIILDPHQRWEPRRSDKVFQVCASGKGLAPFVLTAGSQFVNISKESRRVLEAYGGKYIEVPSHNQHEEDLQRIFDWQDILETLSKEGLRSVMVEGGGHVINTLLRRWNHDLVDSVIVTIAPTWLGQGGVVVSPDRVRDSQGGTIPAARLSSVLWHPLGEDVVLCGRL